MDYVLMWPQMLVAVLFAAVEIESIVKRGQDRPARKHDPLQATFAMVLFVIVLGAGGFWKPLGLG